MRNSAKEKFRCGMCDKFGLHDIGYAVPVLNEFEVQLLGVCRPCHENEQTERAIANTVYLMRKMVCDFEPKQSKKEKPKKGPKASN